MKKTITILLVAVALTAQAKNAYLFTDFIRTNTEIQKTPVMWKFDHEQQKIYKDTGNGIECLEYSQMERITAISGQLNKYVLICGGALYVNRETNEVIEVDGMAQTVYGIEYVQ